MRKVTDVEKSKVCARCKQILPVSEFSPGKQWRDGLFPYCRSCSREAQRVYRDKHREQLKERQRVRYQTDEVYREYMKARALATYQRDPERAKAKVKQWQAANVEKVARIKLDSERRQYAENPEKKRERWRRRHALKLAASVVPFTPEQLQQKVEYWGGACWICGDPYEAIDHVKPLGKGGYHVLSNLRPICTPCNTRKKDRWPYSKPQNHPNPKEVH